MCSVVCFVLAPWVGSVDGWLWCLVFAYVCGFLCGWFVCFGWCSLVFNGGWVLVVLLLLVLGFDYVLVGGLWIVVLHFWGGLLGLRVLVFCVCLIG